MRFLANLLDYTIIESGEVISGSKTDPVKFEEFWTYTGPWAAAPGSFQASTRRSSEPPLPAEPPVPEGLPSEDGSTRH